MSESPVTSGPLPDNNVRRAPLSRRRFLGGAGTAVAAGVIVPGLFGRTETAAAATTEPIPGSLLLGLRFVDGQGPTAELRPIQCADGLRGFVLRGHLHESEPT